MKVFLRALRWLLTALVFFLLFAFALNNQEAVQVHWVFGLSGKTPLVLIIFMAFALGMIIGVLGMLPHWWRQRRQAQVLSPSSPPPHPIATPAPSQVNRIAPSSMDFDYGP